MMQLQKKQMISKGNYLNCKEIIQKKEDKIKRIFLGGGIGMGKSTLAKKLSRKFNLPLLEMDELVYRDNFGNKFTEEETLVRLDKFLEEHDGWIIEGTQKRRWCNKIFQVADLCIILDIHWLICLKRFIKRQLVGLFTNNFQRTNNSEKIKWIRYFREDDLKEYEFMMRRNKATHLFLRTRKQINYFLNKLVKRGYLEVIK